MDLLAYAKNIAGKIEAQSARAGVPVAVSIIDVHGNIILKHRMNGAPVFAADLSERKAYTSALVGLRTADLTPLVQPGQSLLRPDGGIRRTVLFDGRRRAAYLRRPIGSRASA